MLRGIIIFAIGHPYFGRYAYNLAVSIKAVEDIPIAVVHDDGSLNHLSERQKQVFDIFIPTKLTPGCGVKLHAYELSPFDSTLMLDADMVWLPKQKPSELFDKLAGSKFTGITEGSTDNPSSRYFFWANVDEIRDKFSIDKKIYQWRTEVIYFEKDETVAAMFEKALYIHSDHGLSYVKEFAGGVPDEMAINISTAIFELYPHADNWQPSYWAQLYRNTVPESGTLYRDYYLLSCGGNHTTENVKLVYNNIVKAQAPKIGLTHCFPLQSKHSFLQNRRKS